MTLAALCLLAAAQGTLGASFAEQAVYLANLQRVEAGLAPLKLGEKEQAAAQWQAEDLAARDAVTHTDSLGRGFEARSLALGVVRPVAENCAAGQPSPERIVTAWMGSDKHRKNILQPRARTVGIGYATSESGLRHFWTMVLAESDTYPVIIDNEAPATLSGEVELYVHGHGLAREMRFAEEDGAWCEWRPYEARVSWALSPGPGVKRVRCELRDKSGRVFASEDRIARQASSGGR